MDQSEHLFRRSGLGYVLELPEIFTTFNVDRIHRSRDGLHGDLLVKTAFPGIRTVGGTMLGVTFNITSGSIRRSIAKGLADRNPVADEKDQFDWYGFLEELCQGIMLAERDSGEIEEVGDLPDVDKPLPLIDPIIDRDQATLLYGDSGTGKSMFALALAVAVSTGQQTIPGIAPLGGPTNVLYLDYETNREEVDRRIKAICRGSEIPGAKIAYRRCFGPLHEIVEPLAREISERQIGLVIVDPIGYAMGFSRDGGDPAEPALRLFNAFRVFDTTVLGIDHVGKTEDGDGGHRKPYGSSYKSHAARATWELRVGQGNGDLGHLALYHQKHNNTRRFGPFGFSYFASDGLVSWAQEDIEDEILLGSGRNADRIEMALRAHALRVREIAQKTGLSEPNVRQELNRLKGKRFEKIDTGDWKIVDGGLAADET